MSGGSWDYVYSRLHAAADRLLSDPSPLRQDLGRHCIKVATALRAVEWYDSGDYGEEHEDEIRPCLAPETLASISLAEWQARACAAELASERKEHLLALQSAAYTKESRIVVAIGIDPKQPAIYIQSNHGDEESTLTRLMGAVGPWLRLLSFTLRSNDGRKADMLILTDELVQARKLLADLRDADSDCPARDSTAWIAADNYLRDFP